MSNKINIDKINGFNPVRAAGQSDVKKSGGETQKPIEVGKTANEDKLKLSNRATEVGKFVEQVKEMPELREEKINALREQIAGGNYNPSSEDIAEAILRDEKI